MKSGNLARMFSCCIIGNYFAMIKPECGRCHPGSIIVDEDVEARRKVSIAAPAEQQADERLLLLQFHDCHRVILVHRYDQLVGA